MHYCRYQLLAEKDKKENKEKGKERAYGKNGFENMPKEEMQKLKEYRKRYQNTKNSITKQVLFVLCSIKDE